MSCYEKITIALTVISIVTTIIFSCGVWWLTVKANAIAKASLEIAQATYEMQKANIASEIERKYKELQEELEEKSSTNIAEVNKGNKELEKNPNVTTYKAALEQLKIKEAKTWKQKNTVAKKRFLRKK